MLVPNPAATFGPQSTSRARRRRRDLLIGVTCGLLITAGVTSYVLTSGQSGQSSPDIPRGRGAFFPVTLTVKPPWAKITLDGQDIGQTDENGKLRLNLPTDGMTMNWLEVSAKGFHSVRRPVSIYNGAGEVTVELIQKPYDVAIRTQPPDAEVWINEELKGHSPLTFTFAPGEKAQLAVKLAGYEPISKELTPSKDSERLDLDLTLHSSAALARVETEPPGAHVRVNGQIKGITPVDVRIDPSWRGQNINLTAALAGYEDAAMTLTIPNAPNESIPKTVLKLAAAGSNTEIAAPVPGARRIIDGKDQGRAPLVAAPGAQRNRASIEGDTTKGVVFLLASSARAGADHYALLREINGQIHRLGGDQRFAVVVAGQGGARVWPGVGETLPATSDQKIRAYDAVRAIRPADSSSVTSALEAALKLRPSAVWLYTATDLSDDLERLGVAAAGQHTIVHIVTTATAADETRLANWTAQHHGSFTLLGRTRIAFDARPSE